MTVDETIRDAVFKKSIEIGKDMPKVCGYDFNNGTNVDYAELFKSYITTGFQATHLGQAIECINKMLEQRQTEQGLTLFLGYTSNLVSSGLRDIIRFLVQHKLVDCIVSTAGGIEEDFIKCLSPTFVGEFDILPGQDLRKKGLNRIGNLLVPNENYCKFEDWILPILDQLVDEQKSKGVVWTPSSIIHRLGKEIDNDQSIYTWAYRNDIPVFCPALTDGSLGDMIYFHSYKNPGLIIDIVQDIRKINNIAVRAQKSGIVILGGGVVKHHICNANLFRNGADYAVYINTGQEFDGSDAGARPDEAKSWGKIQGAAEPIKVYAEATLVFPIIVAESFAKVVYAKNTKE